MNDIFDYLEQSKTRHLDELIEFLRIPSISSEAKHKDDIRRCAEWLKNHLQNIGLTESRLCETGGNPIVYSEYKGAGAKAPTILIYGHYDVQPVDPLNLWHTDPFEPVVKNNKIIGRGTADDKAQLFTHIKAIEAYLKVRKTLPVNIKFLLEGEEECGSSNLDHFIESNPDLLACDCALISDTEWFADGLPSICYGLRGIAYLQINVTGPNRDVHSGSFGGGIDNPINVLTWIISQLQDKYGRITIPGFYDDVVALTPEERAGFDELPFDLDNYKKDLGIDNVFGENGYSTLERVWCRPSLDVNGIFGGYTGEGAKTIIPSTASAKVSMRLVPNQDALDIADKFKKYILKIAPDTVKVEVEFFHGGNPVLVPRESKAIRACQKAFKTAFGTDSVFMREGGSVPVVGLFDKVLHAPTVLMGFGLPGDNIHSPNENFDLGNFYGGIKTSTVFLDEISK